VELQLLECRAGLRTVQRLHILISLWSQKEPDLRPRPQKRKRTVRKKVPENPEDEDHRKENLRRLRPLPHRQEQTQSTTVESVPKQHMEPSSSVNELNKAEFDARVKRIGPIGRGIVRT
jgi:hypothetical protein